MNSQVSLRVAEPKDAKEILELSAKERVNHYFDWIPEDYRDKFVASQKVTQSKIRKKEQRLSASSDAGIHIVAQTGPKIIGYLGALMVGDHWHVVGLFVASNYQNRGVGKRLVESLVDLAKDKSLTLNVLKANKRAVQFYASLGFRELSGKTNIYFGAQRTSMVKAPNIDIRKY